MLLLNKWYYGFPKKQYLCICPLKEDEQIIINYYHIRNYKSFINLQLTLKLINVLIGSNRARKSCFISLNQSGNRSLAYTLASAICLGYNAKEGVVQNSSISNLGFIIPTIDCKGMGAFVSFFNSNAMTD